MKNIKTFISGLTTAISNCSLYSKDHNSVDDFTARSVESLELLLRESPSLEIMCVENRLIVNGLPFSDSGLQAAKLITRFRRMGIAYIKFLQGVTFAEMRQLIIEMAESGKIISFFPHINTGVLDLRLDEPRGETEFDSGDISEFVSAQIEMVKDVYHNLSTSKNPDVAIVNRIAGNIISVFNRNINILTLLSRAKTREEYTYIHATNVAVLSIFQAEGLGLRDKSILHDLGIAALLHDVGKLFIPDAMLSKKGPLDDEEWEEMKLHPFSGARVLSSIEGLPRLAAIVALQHHLGFNGKGYPAFQMLDTDQHICSQIVSISDCFDALRSARPYRKGLEIDETLIIMRNESGRGLNPVLLDNFMREMHNALSR